MVKLTLNDSAVYNGYLRCNLHDTEDKIHISETYNGKKNAYKITEINSLVVTYPELAYFYKKQKATQSTNILTF